MRMPVFTTKVEPLTLVLTVPPVEEPGAVGSVGPGPGPGPGPDNPGSGGPEAGGSAVHTDPFDDTGGPSPEPPVLPPTDPGTTPALQWLQPFPVVRIRGRTTGRGARVTLLSIAAPAGSEIVARCKGRGCPIRRTAAKVSARGRLVRLRALERHLRSGVRIEIFVTKPGMVGKYTRFKINRLKAPRRVDSCVMPGSRRPSRCPS
jgi:hypothetical protein